MDEDRPQTSDPQPDYTTAEPIRLPFPTISTILFFIIVALFIMMLIVGHGEVTRVAERFGDKENHLIRAGQWWRLITAMFLHGGWTHLITNCLTLLVLGISMERVYGSRKFFMIYMLAGITGNLFSFWFSSAPSLGASGALYGLMGAGMIFPIRFGNRIDPRARRQIMSQLGRALIINLLINFIPGLNLDKWAHFGGILGGGLAALVWIPDVLEEEPPTYGYNLMLWIGTCGMALLTLIAVTEQWRTARHTLMRIEKTTRYITAEGEDWWGMLLPQTWQHVVEAGAPPQTKWVGPGQVVLQIFDSKRSPENADTLSRFLEMHKDNPNMIHSSINIDGKTGQQYIFVEDGNAVHLYAIRVDEHMLYFVFLVPEANFARVNPTIETVVHSLRFVRPPSN